MQYGYFDDEHREYVITSPHTPVKWINYIGALSFGGFVDHTGGALICRQDPALNRITKYISQMPDADFKGETLYVRLKTDAGTRVFSPFYVPCLAPYETYECRVGLGYSRFISRVEGIECEVTVFVPQGADCEVRDISITNHSGAPVEVDLVPVVEYTHFDALKQLTNADWVPQTMQSRLAADEDGIKTIVQYAFMRRDFAVNYFTSNLPASSFETDRRSFLGKDALGSWAAPRSLLFQQQLSNTQANRGDNIAALLHPLGVVRPGETRRLITQLGQAETLEAAQPTIRRFRQPQEVDAALLEQAHFWDKYLGCLQVKTPVPDLDRMLNIHNPHQCYITLNWSRYLSLYQLGYGSRGIGFRDSAQDVMGALASAPAESKDLLKKLLSVQKRDGSAMHQFNPMTMIGEVGDSAERRDRPHYYSDDHLWALLAACAYLKETGDLAFLKEEIPFYDKDEQKEPLEKGNVLEHLCRALAFTRQDVGAHGLPHLGFADWNDTINLATGAESLLTANLYGKALLEMIDLCQFLGETGRMEQFREFYNEMRARVEQSAWDGEWYVSYFDADGTPLGSRQNEAGQIYLYGQAWPVISGFASPEHAHSALEAVNRRLNTPNGIKLSTPGFNGFDPNKGGITTYPPGAKENGGIFLHVNPWVVIAEALQGNGQRAFEYYAQINPASKNERIEEYECEPYVYPQNVLGDEHPQFGLARNAWLSGTSSWMYQAGAQYILGIRPDYSGLCIDPCIPPAWNGFHARRFFRGATYEIEIKNPRHVSRGVSSLEVDGKIIQGNTVPVFTDGGTHTVLVILGK